MIQQVDKKNYVLYKIAKKGIALSSLHV